ncbi:MAG: Tetratricopeptide repeat protein, partial [Euryarchaeota archaeon]|nr:Tetratricopeptide repeat protein [Euryarchaeota archaeon]
MLACMLLLLLPVSSAAQDTAAFWLENGQTSLLNGSFLLAIESFDRAIKIDPENASAWGGKGTALSRQGRYKMAELCFGNALKKDAENVQLWLEDGKAKELAGEWDDARLSYERALALQASLAEAWLGQANASLALGSYEEAMQSFKNASLYGQRDAGKAGQVRALLAQGSSQFKKGKFEAAYNNSNEALALESQNDPALMLKADALSSLGQFEAALACYDQILLGNPSDGMGKEGAARALVGLGEKALVAGNVTLALENFKEASRLAPKSAGAVSGLVKALTAEGDQLWDNGHFSEAIKSYETALVLLPSDPGALAGKEKASAALATKMKEAESGNASRQEIEEASDFARYFELARNQSMNGSYSLALESLNKSLALDARAEAWLLKGQMFFLLGRQSEALDSLDRALEMNQSSVPALALKGRILATIGKYRMAGLFIDSALRLDPENIALWNDLARVQEELQNNKGALQSYDKALKIDDNN